MTPDTKKYLPHLWGKVDVVIIEMPHNEPDMILYLHQQ